MNEVHDAAGRLNAILRSKDWYHRCSVLDVQIDGRLRTALNVWGEYVGGKVPNDAPRCHEGYTVVFSRVTQRNECPFGSVRARTRSKREQDAKVTTQVTEKIS